MPHAEPKTKEYDNKVKKRQQITEALGTNVYDGTFENTIPNNSVFKKDLKESNVTADQHCDYLYVSKE